MTHETEDMYLAKIDALYAELARAYELVNNLREDVVVALHGEN